MQQTAAIFAAAKKWGDVPFVNNKMSASQPTVHSRFSASVLDVAAPAILQHRDWVGDEEFVACLCASWQTQYADYIGDIDALTLVSRLLHNGDLLDHEPSCTLVAVMGNTPVGVASIRALEGLSLITLLEVLDEHQGLGIGKQLVRALATVNTPLLAHASVHRPAVKTFYESLGFQSLPQTTVDHYEHSMLFDVMVRPVDDRPFFE